MKIMTLDEFRNLDYNVVFTTIKKQDILDSPFDDIYLEGCNNGDFGYKIKGRRWRGEDGRLHWYDEINFDLLQLVDYQKACDDYINNITDDYTNYKFEVYSTDTRDHDYNENHLFIVLEKEDVQEMLNIYQDALNSYPEEKGEKE